MFTRKHCMRISRMYLSFDVTSVFVAYFAEKLSQFGSQLQRGTSRKPKHKWQQPFLIKFGFGVYTKTDIGLCRNSDPLIGRRLRNQCVNKFHSPLSCNWKKRTHRIYRFSNKNISLCNAASYELSHAPQTQREPTPLYWSKNTACPVRFAGYLQIIDRLFQSTPAITSIAHH